MAGFLTQIESDARAVNRPAQAPETESYGKAFAVECAEQSASHLPARELKSAPPSLAQFKDPAARVLPPVGQA